MTRIKICGLTTDQDISYVNETHPEYAGFVLFFPKSKRNVSIDTAVSLLEKLDPSISSVAVVVSPTADQMRQIRDAGFSRIQIHGQFPPDWPEDVDLPIWKAIQAGELDSYEQWLTCDRVEGFVFDAAEPGSGKTFDWTALATLSRGSKLIFLAGGLSPTNVKHAIEMATPDGVDVSSGVEYNDRPGKDPEKIRSFICRARDIN